MIKVSVIIPVYNVEKYLEACLDGIVSQSLQDIEIICVNDGSSDHSLDILKEYESQYSGIKVLHQENQGLSNARNAGLEAAGGGICLFF